MVTDKDKQRALELAWDALRWADSPDEGDPCDQWTEIPRDRAQKAFDAVWVALGEKCPDLDSDSQECEHSWVTDNFGPTMCSKCGVTSNIAAEVSTANG